MFKHLVNRLATTLLGATVFATPVFAQKPAVARLTPYVGYIQFGSFVDGPIGSRISNQGTAIFGGELGLDIAPNVSIVGNVGYADSNIEVGLPIIGGFDIADSKVLLYDGALQLRLPMTSSLGSGITPFVQGGLGAMRYEIRAGSLETKSTNLAANVGAGIDLQLSRNLGVKLMAKDYIGKFDMSEATGFNLSQKTTHNWALTAGITLGF
ncbi:MAG: outer membrane beta-barrel protein [Gemmatimonadaceae bacterium]